MYSVLKHRKGLQIWFWPDPFLWERAWANQVEEVCASSAGQRGCSVQSGFDDLPGIVPWRFGWWNYVGGGVFACTS